MYLAEFEAIWNAQKTFHKSLMTNALRVSIKKAIFDQRPLKIQKHLVGGCTFEPCDENGIKITVWDKENKKERVPIRKRAARATLPAQRFRILQDVNNLTVKDPATRDYRELLPEERKIILSILETTKKPGWNTIRKKLKLNNNETFNLEEGKKSTLLGDTTSCTLKTILGKKWQAMNNEDRDQLVTDMLTIDSHEGLMKRFAGHWGFDEEAAEKLTDTVLEKGYLNLSRKAILNIIPHLEDGLKYDEACKAAGYHHSKAQKNAYPTKLGEVPNLRNPVVQKALNETRKLVNAITKEYGHPDKIRIEMARDMKLSDKKRKEVQANQKKLETANSQAAEILRTDFNIEPSRTDIQRYNLWLECNMTCPYTGTPISKEMLFSGEVDIEHILPYSRSWDDSYMNKTLCMANENRRVKHSRTPYEAYHANEEKYDSITQRVKKYAYKKLRRFEQKEIETDKFLTRQLNDTRYICKEVKRFLEGTGSTVEVTKGMATAVIRYTWGLNKVLGDDLLNAKERIDHRHHAIDAIVIALTGRRLFQRLSAISASSDGLAPGRRGFHLPKPWDGFFNDVCDNIENVIVSHAQSHTIQGALHEDTAYGYSEAQGCFVVRKAVENLTKPMIAKIRDDKVRELIQARIAEFDEDIKKALGDPQKPVIHSDGKTPIRSVRITTHFEKDTLHAIKDKEGAPYKYFKYGNNHHVEILENIETGKRKGVFITAMEAARRARRDKTEIIQRDHGSEWRFVMALFSNDMVEVERDGKKQIYRVQKMSHGKIDTITLKINTDTTTDYNSTTLHLQSMEATKQIKNKLFINALGKIGSSND
jgi:CRISPR-associated endonuclease Csn1